MLGKVDLKKVLALNLKVEPLYQDNYKEFEPLTFG